MKGFSRRARVNNVSRSGCFLAFILSCSGLQRGETHPAHAKPVNYPFVVGFERFHSSQDGDDYLAEGGLLLFNELNCVACHEPPKHLKSRLKGVEATDLRGVGTRLGTVDLEIMIRNPRFLKRDTPMPSLFSGPDRDLDEIEALKQFLLFLTADIPDYPDGDVETGKRRYHRMGCVSCHAPEVGYRPEELPESTELELAGLPSVPMNLADRYKLDPLVHFLLDPRSHRPSGRMPDFSLSVEEAADIAAYLKAGSNEELAKLIASVREQADSIEEKPELIPLGREVYVKRQCYRCHGQPEVGTDASYSPPPMAELNPDSESGCFSTRPLGRGIPFYGLDVVQKKAISEALRRSGEKRSLTPEEELDWQMMILNCYACHERDGKGGAELAREIYFAPATEEALKLGRWGSIPPALDNVGSKLTDLWWEKILLGEHSDRVARSYLETRMPLYRPEEVKPLIGYFRKLDKKKIPGAAIQLPASKGNEVEPAWKAECRSCHPFGKELATEMPGIDLELAPERLRFEWFLNLLAEPDTLLPGVPMQPIGDQDKVKEIWNHLKSLP